MLSVYYYENLRNIVRSNISFKKTGIDTIPVDVAQRHYEEFLQRAITLLKEAKIKHVNMNKLKYMIETLRLSGEAIVARIYAQHEARVRYDEYAKKVLRCQRVPQYLFVYCDVVKSQLVGDAMGRLLRIVRVPEQDERGTHHVEFSRPQFMPVSQHYFPQFMVDIRDERGCPVSFASEPLIMKLHFKRVS